jgi:hypothetical protein
LILLRHEYLLYSCAPLRNQIMLST